MSGRYQVEAWNDGETDTAEQCVCSNKKKALTIAKVWKWKYFEVEVYDTKTSEFLYSAIDTMEKRGE